MKEKLQEYAQIAEIVSAAAVLAGLIFVGLQVRQGAEETAANTAAMRASVQQAMMEADKDLLLFQTRVKYDRRLAGLEIDDPTPLDRVDTEFFYFGAFVRTRQHYWSQYNAGLLDHETYMSYMNPFIVGLLNGNPAARLAFLENANNGFFPAGFVDEVNRLWSERFPNEPMNPVQ